MNVSHTLSDIDVDLIAEALKLLPLGRSHELYARLMVTHGQANQAAMQELAEARAAKAEVERKSAEALSDALATAEQSNPEGGE